MENLNNTQYFTVQKEPELQVRDVLEIVFRALSEKGYNPVNQIVGYIMSGEGLLITNCRFSILAMCSCRFIGGFCWQHHFKSLFISPVYRIILIDIGTLLYASVMLQPAS